MRLGTTEAEILATIQSVMKDLFDLDPARVRPEAKLIDDLELDSIDAIDLAAKVEEATGRSFDEALLRRLRTVQDVIMAIQELLRDAADPAGKKDQPLSA